MTAVVELPGKGAGSEKHERYEGSKTMSHTFSNAVYPTSPSIGGHAKFYANATSPSGKIDERGTFKKWQESAIDTRRRLQESQAEFDAKRQEIQKTYLPDAARQRLAPLEKALNDAIKIAEDTLIEQLDEVCEAKRAAFEKSMSAPTDEQIRLLTALNFRSDISMGEAASLAQRFAGNLTAMKAFRSILTKSNLRMPELPTEESFEAELSEARQYGLRMIGMLSPTSEQTLDAHHFYAMPGIGLAPRYFVSLDSMGFTTPTIEENGHDSGENVKDGANSSTAQEKPSEGTKSGFNAIQYFVQGGESLALMAEQCRVSTAAIRQANPDINFDRPLYSGQKIVIPSSTIRYSQAPGAANPGAAIPTHYEPPRTYEEGEELSVDDL